MPNTIGGIHGETAPERGGLDVRRQAALLKTGALQDAIFSSAYFSSIATDENGVIQIFNVGAERMLGYTALEVMNKITPADISDPQEVIARAAALSVELGTPITPGFDALVFKASRGIEDIYELTYVRKDGSRFPAIVSVTALRDDQDTIIGYLLIGTDNTARKQAEEALLKAGALQSAIFNSVNFSSIATDAKGVIQIFNVGAERMLGYTALEVMNKITPADISDPQEVIARAAALSVELGTPITPGFEALVFKASRSIEDIYELTYFRKDGSRLPAIVSVTALRDDQGAIIGYLLIGTDNTARKQAEMELQKAAALQTAIFDSAHFSSIATDEKGVIQLFNVGAQRMLGYTAAEVVDKITPADISDAQEVIARAAALSQELNTPITPGFEALAFKASRAIEDIYELTYIRKDGSRFPAIVSVTALRDGQGRIIGYLLIGSDNTARKLVEEAQAEVERLRSDQEFYTRSLIEANIDALMMTTPLGIISDVNQQMIALSGCSREALVGVPCRNFFTEPGRADIAIERVLTEDRVSDFELTVRARNGAETMVSYNAAVFRDREGVVQGVFAAARDVTERKRLDRILSEKNIEVEHANRMKSEFLATMSHELRTPLNAIIGFSEALKDGLIGTLSDVQLGYIEDIFNSGQHLLSLINDILDLSKVEAGMMALELEPIELNSLLSNSLIIVRERAVAQRISLELETDEEFGTLQVDLRKTKQIVYNLLSNAVKFTANGGRVILRVRRVPRSAVGILPGNWPVHGFPLADSAFTEFLEICVSDNGLGIAVNDMPKLFQAFSQIDSSLARMFEGTGLGLAMVKQLAELHGGGVAVASAFGEGSRFAVWLPLRDLNEMHQAPATTHRSGIAMLADAPKERVALIVEDDDRAAELARLLLEAEGFVVLRAASAEDALLMAPQQALSLITLDILLPGIDGWEFLMRIREDRVLAQVPVVVISIVADANNMALAGGASAVLQKPISRAQLKAALSSLGLEPCGATNYTVLVVDDDPKAVEVIATFLPSPTYAVVRAYGGSEAIVLAQQLLPDLILLDLMMPEVSGFDVVAALQHNPSTVGIPILIVTAKQITADDRAALNSHPDIVIHIVEKSGLNQARFIAEVRRALATR
jgi:PAS domain S-box-containing protein